MGSWSLFTYYRIILCIYLFYVSVSDLTIMMNTFFLTLTDVLYAEICSWPIIRMTESPNPRDINHLPSCPSVESMSV